MEMLIEHAEALLEAIDDAETDRGDRCLGCGADCGDCAATCPVDRFRRTVETSKGVS